MTRAWGPLNTLSTAGRRRHRTLVRTLAGVACAVLVLGACGGDDDDDGDSSSTTTSPTDISTAPTSALPETTVTTVAPITTPPATVTYVTEGAQVIVTNASRVDGAAGRMSDRLRQVGFQVVEPGNYTLGKLEVSQILYDPSNPQALAVAQSLQAALGGGGIQVVEMGSPPPVDGGDLKGATVLIAMGNDTADKTLEELQGVAPATSAPDTTDATDTTGGTDTTTESTTT